MKNANQILPRTATLVQAVLEISWSNPRLEAWARVRGFQAPASVALLTQSSRVGFFSCCPSGWDDCEVVPTPYRTEYEARVYFIAMKGRMLAERMALRALSQIESHLRVVSQSGVQEMGSTIATLERLRHMADLLVALTAPNVCDDFARELELDSMIAVALDDHDEMQRKGRRLLRGPASLLFEEIQAATAQMSEIRFYVTFLASVWMNQRAGSTVIRSEFLN